jgi:hypothetical protein
MKPDMSAAGVEARLRQVSALAEPLRPELRLVTKIDLSARGVAARLEEASQLLELCRALGRAAPNRDGG